MRGLGGSISESVGARGCTICMRFGSNGDLVVGSEKCPFFALRLAVDWHIISWHVLFFSPLLFFGVFLYFSLRSSPLHGIY